MQEYVRRVSVAVKLGVLDLKGASMLNVRHEDNCPRLSGGQCSCDPEVFIDAVNDADGVVCRCWITKEGLISSEKP